MDNKELLKQMIADGVLTQEVAAKYCPELIEDEDERIRKEILTAFSCGHDNSDIYGHGITYGQVRAWLEKQGKQKPTGKVEPKFHEGEWITNGDYTWKIVEVKPLDYILQSQDGNIVDDTVSHVDEQFHSFTIKDAKDGDVLYSPCCKLLWIYKDGNSCYIGNNLNYNEKCVVVNSPIYIPTDVVPATKEQRDLLFQKMKEVGYEWDVEKKELKEIEQKQSFDIEIPFGAKDSELQEVSYHIPEGFHAEIEGNKVIIKKGEQKHTWSEEDERIKNNLLSELTNLSARKLIDKETKDKYVNWLKSLRPQNKWKPSKRQMMALNSYLPVIKGSGDKIQTILESLYDDLLKLKY